jgi:hypothetical protein
MGEIMIFSTGPVTFSDAQQLNPEQLNRLILTAVAQLNLAAARRYRIFDICPPISADASEMEILRLPIIEDFQYIVERVVVSGKYTGNQYITWQYATDSLPRQQLDFPADGNDGVAYTAVMLPGVLLDGYGGTTNSNKFVLNSSSVLSTMRTTVQCRSLQGLVGDSPVVPPIELFRDNEVLTAARWQGVIDILTNFQSQINARSPLLMSGMYFSNFDSTTDAALRKDQIFGNEKARVVRIVGDIAMASAAAGGSTITVDYGFGTVLSGSFVVAVDTGNPHIAFDSGAISIEDNNRSYLGNNDEFQVRVTSNSATLCKKMQIYILQDNAY